MATQPTHPPAGGRTIERIVIHCAATPNGRHHDAAEIDAWHAQRGFDRGPLDRLPSRRDLPHIGYHRVILLSGQVQHGRSDAERGAHARGYNRTSIGICLIGTDAFTTAQWDALLWLVRSLKERYPDAQVVGHRDLPGVTKRCPGFDVRAWWTAQQPPSGHVLN
ncbi:N-acetylmuramoyl-L-alanine amidase [Endothiovibrio diazotrophicus]